MASAIAPDVPGPEHDGGAEFDLFLPLRSAGSLENPYPVYGLLRTVRPVMQVPVPDYEGPGVWLFSRYRDVHGVLRDPRFSADRMNAPLFRDNLERLPAFIQQMQINVVDASTLRRAQARPELFESLVVRVGGFSTYFNWLSRAHQDDIIARTEHAL